eukprot:6152759-Amphidinium_carterae.1
MARCSFFAEDGFSADIEKHMKALISRIDDGLNDGAEAMCKRSTTLWPASDFHVFLLLLRMCYLLRREVLETSITFSFSVVEVAAAIFPCSTDLGSLNNGLLKRLSPDSMALARLLGLLV